MKRIADYGLAYVFGMGVPFGFPPIRFGTIFPPRFFGRYFPIEAKEESRAVLFCAVWIRDAARDTFFCLQVPVFVLER